MRNQMTWSQQQNSILYFKIILRFYIETDDSNGHSNCTITGACLKKEIGDLISEMMTKYKNIKIIEFHKEGAKIVSTELVSCNIITREEYKMFKNISKDGDNNNN